MFALQWTTEIVVKRFLAELGFSSFSEYPTRLYFFTPIPCTYTNSPLDGMARNYYYYFLYTWMHKTTQFVMSWSILFLPPYTQEAIRSELESNPGPLASQATALTASYKIVNHL